MQNNIKEYTESTCQQYRRAWHSLWVKFSLSSFEFCQNWFGSELGYFLIDNYFQDQYIEFDTKSILWEQEKTISEPLLGVKTLKAADSFLSVINYPSRHCHTFRCRNTSGFVYLEQKWAATFPGYLGQLSPYCTLLMPFEFFLKQIILATLPEKH